jgi:hypothetical protein
MRGYITAKEAAKKLGYEYTHFSRLLKEGNVEGAVYWHGYAIPDDIQRGDVTPATPKRNSKT